MWCLQAIGVTASDEPNHDVISSLSGEKAHRRRALYRLLKLAFLIKTNQINCF
jgi:hypothetical protein